MITRGALGATLDWTSDIGLREEIPYFSTTYGAAYQGDALNLLRRLRDDSVNLVLTSPPFALTRKKSYGNKSAKHYVEWARPLFQEALRALRPDGSLVIDLGGSWVPGSPTRNTYQFEVLLALIADGFHLAQEFYWFNPAKLPSPAEWVTVRRIRVKDAVNTVWWLSKTAYPKADNRKVLTPYSASMRTLLKTGPVSGSRPSGHELTNGFATDNGGAIPPNLLTIANTESNSTYLRACRTAGITPHPARFPESLVHFFLKFLTIEGDLVVDPFAGSVVTGAACESSKRRWLAFELDASYLNGATARFGAIPRSNHNANPVRHPRIRR